MSLKEGVTMKKGFKPEASSPPATKVGRPKPDDPNIKRKNTSVPKC
jgi:hypothetical protein